WLKGQITGQRHVGQDEQAAGIGNTPTPQTGSCLVAVLNGQVVHGNFEVAGNMENTIQIVAINNGTGLPRPIDDQSGIDVQVAINCCVIRPGSGQNVGSGRYVDRICAAEGIGFLNSGS